MDLLKSGIDEVVIREVKIIAKQNWLSYVNVLQDYITIEADCHYRSLILQSQGFKITNDEIRQEAIYILRAKYEEGD